ncbi:MAG: hydantoinase/oxoprolinase family protein [Candidatus Binatia bacterium]
MGLRIGIDVGGTFTDFLLMGADGTSSIHKVLSTPDDPSIAVIDGLTELAAQNGLTLRDFFKQVDIIVHGTTVTTNAVLTGKFARTALVTTRGFRDALEMRRGVREKLYDNKYAPPIPLVPRHLRIPVTERSSAEGKVITPLDCADLEAAAEIIRSENVEAIAVCFMHSYANHENEQIAARRLKELFPDSYLSISSEVIPQVRFYERVSTTVLNAVVGPILKRYLDKLIRKIADAEFPGVLLIMQSNGGVSAPAAVADLAASTLLSGPAAAPVAGLAYMAVHGENSFITTDMGGTSFDAALVKGGVPAVTSNATVERMALALPTMEIITIGAGGGSIGWIDDGGLLRMGPQSAGAKPGPVCYGLGGILPTCSDANLVLGYLNPDFFAGGRIQLDSDAARDAVATHIGSRLHLDPVQAAAGMYHIMNVNMASAIREISVQKGFDPREFPMVCAGGAGAIHACMIARELGITRILVPREASIFCAAGMLRSDLKRHFVRSHATALRSGIFDHAEVKRLVAEMKNQAEELLHKSGVSTDQHRFSYQLDLRYAGQYHEVMVDIPEGLLASGDLPAIAVLFHTEHNRLYGYDLGAEGTQVDLVNIRLVATGLVQKPTLVHEAKTQDDVSVALKGRRRIYLSALSSFTDVPVFDGDKLRHGHEISGPAVVESVNTTIIVPGDFNLWVDAVGTCVLQAHS